MLPFLIPRLYRPLMIQAWNITNTDIGTAFSAYGLSAMICYFIGGGFADKYSPKNLIGLSLVITAFGSIFLLMSPSRLSLISVYFFFGISTILLMWGALIKVGHLAGGNDNRATAMGILDAGRGLIAAVMSSVLILLIGIIFPAKSLEANSKQALTIIYLIVSVFTAVIGFLIWKKLDLNLSTKNDGHNPWTISQVKEVLLNSKVWFLGVVILSAYCGYKSIDNYSVYLVDIHKLGLEDSANLTSILFWLRPLSALMTGLIADRYHNHGNLGRFKILIFLLLFNALLQFTLVLFKEISFILIFINILCSATFAYALRAIYFSIFGDLKFRDHLIGTIVGITSFIGFLPDMFFGIITGSLIDKNPGVLGYQYTFTFTGAILIIGTMAALILFLQAKKLR